jgi:ribosome maturation factor RimP
VENVPYERLEVSSPGLDRPLRKLADYQRFAGHEVDITLKLAFQNRKKYRGVLEADGDAWRLVFKDGKQEQALNFSLDEVREARLVPVVDFKGRRGKAGQGSDAQGRTQEDGGQES